MLNKSDETCTPVEAHGFFKILLILFKVNRKILNFKDRQ